MDITHSQTRIVTLFGSTMADNQTNYIQYHMLATSVIMSNVEPVEMSTVYIE